MKIYGEGQKILGAGADDYSVTKEQWIYDITREMGYVSALGKRAQYFNEAEKKCYIKTETMLDKEEKQKQAEIEYENQLEIKKQEEINKIKASL